MNAFTKPPNVLVYVGENGCEVYKEIESNLLRCIDPDRYVIYRATSIEILQELWKENILLLIIACESIDDRIVKSLNDYLEKHGKILMCCTGFNLSVAGLQCKREIWDEHLIKITYKNTCDAVLWKGKYSYMFPEDSPFHEVLCKDGNGASVVYKIYTRKGIFILSEVHVVQNSNFLHSSRSSEGLMYDKVKQIEVLRNILINDLGLRESVSSLPELSPGYVIVENASYLEELKRKLKIKEIPVKQDSFSSSEIKLPIVFETPEESLSFNKNIYFSHLRTDMFGHFVIFYPVITTTMAPAEHLSEFDGVVVIANRQIQGRGRSSNKWISPEGCAMFTLHFNVCLSSNLGQRLSVLQHLASLALVHSVRKLPGYEKLDIRLKWPNDIYFGKQSKIGGVIANTSVQGSIAHVYLGCGINVTNSRPTVCINDIIDIHNSSNNDCLQHLQPETIIACALTEMEYFVQSFSKGADTFLSSYYSYWMHDNQQVKLASLNEQATISGIDDFGFLIVCTDKGQKLVLQPDGNRFDIMQNLIINKQL